MPAKANFIISLYFDVPGLNNFRGNMSIFKAGMPVSMGSRGLEMAE
jgi:hypothetical protein